MNVKNIFLRIFGFFFPNVCFSCGEIIDEGHHLCEKCQNSLSVIAADKACPFCGLEKPDCDCRFSIYYFNGISSCFFNDGAARNMVYNYKFHHRDYYSVYLANLMTNDLRQKLKDIKFDYITSVPMSLPSYLKRGFNQTDLLARQIGKSLNVPVKHKVLGCRFFSATQHLSDFKDRFNNVRDKYFVKKHIKADNVLLIDDIKTTGATLDACARQLLYSGAKHVYCLTVVAGAKKSSRK